MNSTKSNSDDSSFRRTTVYLQSLLYFSLLAISLPNNSICAQQYDSAQTRIFYEEIIRQTACGGNGDGLSEGEFYRLLDLYLPQDKKERQGFSFSFSYDNDNNNSISNNYTQQNSQSVINQKATSDTVARIVYVRDTVFMSADLPSSKEMVVTQEILKKIIQDKELAAVIRATVAEMPAKELEKFQQELNKEFRNMKSELALEQARRTIAELEAKKAAALERKEKWKALSKEERKELIKARTKIIAHETAETAGLVVLGTGAVLAGGIIAIGKGIIDASRAIWNWLDEHFYVKIDLSCEAQRQLRAYRQAHHYKPSKIKKYKGHCPTWAN